MPNIFAATHIKDKPNEFFPLNIDFEEKSVSNLKEEIAAILKCDANTLELIYNGLVLDDDVNLAEVMRPNSTVHCFLKTKKYVPYQPPDDVKSKATHSAVHSLFNVIAHIQISVNSRVNILQKVLAEYPEFRRNLGAQALIRDSVLFNTFHQPEVIKNLAEHYPLICDAAPFIVDTIKKELTKGTIRTYTDSNNSSEEDNSLGASSTSEVNRSGAETSSNDQTLNSSGNISRAQLQQALAQIRFSSVNSLSSIAQRNTDTNVSSAALSNSASGERISSEVFRNELQRALNSLSSGGVGTGSPSDTSQRMDTTEGTADNSMNIQETSEDGSGDSIPAYYRTHVYAEQLRTMAQMGFINYDENLTYLNITNGNIENAINLLMGSMN